MKDTKEILACPACGTDMVKVLIENEGLYLDVCLDGCGGIYFDNRELEKFDEKDESISDLAKAYEGKEFKKVDTSMDRVCPTCGHNFVKHFVSSKQEIEIDDCYTCGGKFLDYGELEKMRDQYNNTQERIDDVVNCMYKIYGQDLVDTNMTDLSRTKKRGILRELFSCLTGLG